MTKKDKATEDKNVEDIIKRHVYWAVGAGLIPVPLADIAAVSAIQLDMLKQICKFYDIDYSEEKGKAWISALASSTLSAIAAKIGASVVKSIPVIGTVVGATSMAILSGASTHALGNVFSDHFQGGGQLDNLNTDKVKSFYDDKVKEGKEIAKKLKKKYMKLVETPEGKNKEKQVAKKLAELDKMKEKGHISEEEYQDMRKKILTMFMGE